MTPALLFALVDAVLRERERNARSTCGFSEQAERRWIHRGRMVGWWRSLWPLGGGA